MSSFLYFLSSLCDVETILQATISSSDSGEKKPLIESIKAGIVALVSYIIALILKPFQMLKGLFATKTIIATAQAIPAPGTSATVTPVITNLPTSVPAATASDIAAKKYALEKLKEIDHGNCLQMTSFRGGT